MAEQIMQETADKAIPAGYKQTEVGVIPEDWRVFEIQDLIYDLRGGAPFKPSDFTKQGVKVLPKGGVVRGGILKIKEIEQQYCDVGFASKYVKNSVDEKYTIVVLRDLVPSGPSIGLMVRISHPDNYVLAQGVYGFLSKSKALSDYLIQYSNTSVYRRAANEIMVGSTQVHITNGAFKSIRIGLPNGENEQTAIANVLSDTDALIDALEQLIAKKQAIKRATMQQLLTGRTRLPAFALRPDGTPKGYKPSELGDIPEDWDVVCAGDFGKFRGGNGFPVIEQGKLNGEYPFYKVSDMNNEGNDVYMSVSNNWIFKEDQSRIGSFVFPSGCIVFAKVGAAVFLERKKILSMPSCIDNNMAALELNRAKCDVNFVYHFLQSIRFGDFVSTTALPSLNASVLSKIKIITPLIKEQTAIATILSDMDNELQALTQKLEKARALKQGMMQQLLTGKIRLPLAAGA